MWKSFFPLQTCFFSPSEAPALLFLTRIFPTGLTSHIKQMLQLLFHRICSTSLSLEIIIFKNLPSNEITAIALVMWTEARLWRRSEGVISDFPDLAQTIVWSESWCRPALQWKNTIWGTDEKFQCHGNCFCLRDLHSQICYDVHLPKRGKGLLWTAFPRALRTQERDKNLFPKLTGWAFYGTVIMPSCLFPVFTPQLKSAESPH